MILIVDDYFRKIGAKIYYVTGHKKSYVKVFPALGKRKFILDTKLTLDEYLTAYGFNIKKDSLFKTKKDATCILDFMKKADFDVVKPILTKLQTCRSKKNTEVKSIEGLADMLSDLSFDTKQATKIDKYEVRYLTGDWFEEYIYYKVKEELSLSDSEIGKGYKLTKDIVPNEIDVLFIYEHKLYIIECKTSFYHSVAFIEEKDGEKKERIKQKNLLPEIIYKSDALRTKFGLFANTSVFTLSPLKDDNNEIIKNLKPHVERAELSRITLVSKKDIIENKSIKELLKIK